MWNTYSMHQIFDESNRWYVGKQIQINSHSLLFYCDTGLPNFESHVSEFPSLKYDLRGHSCSFMFIPTEHEGSIKPCVVDPKVVPFFLRGSISPWRTELAGINLVGKGFVAEEQLWMSERFRVKSHQDKNEWQLLSVKHFCSPFGQMPSCLSTFFWTSRLWFKLLILFSWWINTQLLCIYPSRI